MINQQPSDRSQGADETNQASSPSDGEAFLNDVMKPVSEGAGFFTNKTATAGVYDPNDPFRSNASAPQFHASNTALDAEYATQIQMAEPFEAVNQAMLTGVPPDPPFFLQNRLPGLGNRIAYGHND